MIMMMMTISVTIGQLSCCKLSWRLNDESRH